MKYVTITADIRPGKVASVVGWEDVTVFLNAEEGHSQFIQVAIDRDDGGLGQIKRWYTYTYHQTTLRPVVLLAGCFRYVRVINESQEELAFSVSGRYIK